jgi:nucleoside-diphosphate-sugar epimerase
MKKILIGMAFSFLAACSSTPHRSGTVLLVGASSGTGLEIAKVLAARGDDVTAFVRPTSNRSGLAPLNVKYVVGDATNFADVKAAFTHQKVRAVVSTLGGRPGEPRPDFVGTRNLVDAAKAAGVRRMILITVIGTGDSAETLPVRVRENLAKVIPLKNSSEAYLSSSGLAYTIIRPGGLTNAAGDGKSFLTLDHSMMSSISRAELARLTVSALDDDRTIDRIYHAIDPTHAVAK